ncbi:ferrochelatase [Psychrosphaera algicola]|uniref:Ferrochelatase n=1 Tax=Psychrosphaera algicola TaxID=3023714 RepID=A0ABT5FI25_9GAMM|nr:ferrochelatase [Psychrosphaera sp. G1-22]MDC2890841.1 ferrochelatase [Psychrosphaera sp. G1-22]
MKYINSENYKHEHGDKIGVLLVNLGTPEAPTKAAVKPYLKQFLSDPRVVEIPRVIWYMILNGIILPFRSKRSAHAYQQIWTEQGSPLLANTASLCGGVVKRMAQKHPNLVVDFAMRYGKPDMESKLQSLLDKGATKLIVLPLYPQYSATTTGSTFDEIARLFSKRRWFPELRFVNQYHDDPNYIEALANKVKAHWQQHGKAEKLVLSFHGIPKRFWLNGDPYVCQCFKTARLLAEKLELTKDEMLTCFQSRFGKAEWVQPYLEGTLKALPGKGVKSVQVFSLWFSVDCLETLEEIAVENKEYFEDAGGERFQYIPCLNDDESHVDMIMNVIERHASGWDLADGQSPEAHAEANANLRQSVIDKEEELSQISSVTSV